MEHPPIIPPTSDIVRSVSILREPATQIGHRAVAAGCTMAMVTALLSVIGCHNWRPAPPQPHNRAVVRVSYREPRDVMAVTSAGDSVRIAGVRQLEGDVVRAVPETLYVRIVAVPARGFRSPQDGVVAVTQAPDVTVSEQVVSKTKTFALLLGATALVSAGFFALVILCFDGC